jgi:hypothetical protein
MALTLTKIAETTGTITLGWTPPPDAHSYVFYAKGKRVTQGTPFYERGDRKGQARDRVEYAKGGEPYEVAALCLDSGGVFQVEVGRYETTPQPPGLPPRSSNVIRRFSRVHSSQFTACRNKYVPPGSTSWWAPPEATGGTLWRGTTVGQENITTSHGEGIRFNGLDEMVFLGVSENRMCACELQGSWPQYEGQTHQWDGWVRLPSAGNTGGVPGGFYHGHVIMQIGGTTGGGADTNGHMLQIAPERRFRFVIRATDEPHASTRYDGPVFSYDTWHHIRWEVHWTEASNGFQRAWVNGSQMMNHSGPTIFSGEVMWEQMLGWYSTRTGIDNQIEFSEWQLARL